MVDPVRLSTAETRVLRLLAEGHTAKSAAAELGLSVNVVNERLREARAKTGVGSSRELARRLRNADGSQIFWDEKMGLAPPPGRTATGWRGGLNGSIRPLKGSPTMIIISASTGAAVAVVAAVAAGVHGPGAPHVVSCWPAPGAVVAPGPVDLSVTYDRPMLAGSYSFVVLDPPSYPDCAAQPVQSADRKTFTLACQVRPHHSYDIGFNSRRFRNFVSAEGAVPAKPYELRFTTR